jgi:hypothetical protein
MNNKKPLDVILSVVLMIGLLWAGIYFFNKKGPLKMLGGFLLLILSINVLDTSQFWLNGMTWATNAEQKLFNGLEATKHGTA